MKTLATIILAITTIAGAHALNDKTKHEIAGASAYPFFQNINYQLFKMPEPVSYMAAFPEVAMLGAGKELYDCVKKDPTGFNTDDIAHTVKGSLYSAIPTYLIDRWLFPTKYAPFKEQNERMGTMSRWCK